MINENKISKIEKKFNDLLNTNDKILIISKNDCPNCKKLKEIFDTLDINYNIYLYEETKEEIDSNFEFKTYLKELTKSKMFPFCFVDKEYIGSYKEVQNYFCTGKLKEILNKIGIDYEEDF